MPDTNLTNDQKIKILELAINASSKEDGGGKTSTPPSRVVESYEAFVKAING